MAAVIGHASSDTLTPPHAGFRPVRVVEVEMTMPLPVIPADMGSLGVPYATAFVLVRVHGHPVGTVSIDLTAGPCSPQLLARQVDAELGEAIAAHLAADVVEGRDPRSEPPCRTRLDVGTEPPLVSVLVATCRRTEALAACLDSLLANDYPNFEVLVVDNSPGEPGTREMMATAYRGEPRVRYLQEWAPGTSRARNTGLRAARGEIVAITDDDVVVDRGWVRAMAATLCHAPDVACVTGLTQPYELETEPQVWFEQFSGMAGGYVPRLFDLSMSPRPTLLFPYTPACGGSNNMAVRRSVVEAMEGFDVRLGPGTPTGGGEDLDLFIRILLAGHTIAYEPLGIVWHKHRREAGDLRRHVFGYGAGALAVLTKWFLRHSALRVRLLSRVRQLPATFGSREHQIGPDTSPPSALARAQLAGFACGPWLWLRSASQQRRLR